MIARETGVSGFLHPEGVYDDPKGGVFRGQAYRRLRFHFQFQNEKLLFEDVDHHTLFSVNVYGKVVLGPEFQHISNLFVPATIDGCFTHSGHGTCGGIKDDDGDWNVQPHADRVLRIDGQVLELFATLFDPPGTIAVHARLPSIHSSALVNVLRKLSRYPRRLADIEDDYRGTVMWDETGARRAGILRRETHFPESITGLILAGSHYHIGNPLYKTPRSVCETNSEFDPLDLTELRSDYLPRANYVQACTAAEYFERVPTVPWDGQPVTAFYRTVTREMVDPAGERTLVGCITPPAVGHVHTSLSIAFRETHSLLRFAAAVASLPVDFRVRSTGMAHANLTLLGQLPLLVLTPKHEAALFSRILMLNGLTTHHADLWRDGWNVAFQLETWTKSDPRLAGDRFSGLRPAWSWKTPLRGEYERRQALIEIDVLVAMALGLTLEELRTMYRVQFPVLRQYEQDTWYDRKGRIVFTVSRGLPGVSIDGTRWKQIRDMATGTVTRTVTDDTRPGGPRERTIEYVAPFDRCDREADYATAWAAFAARGLG